MDLSELEKECRLLMEVIESSLRQKEANAWQQCYHWWLLYKKINTELDQANDLDEKNQIISSFLKFQEELSKRVENIYVEVGIDPKKIPLLDDKMQNYPPHMNEIILVMRHQRKIFLDHLKQVKAEKEGRKTGHAQKMRQRKKKWLKS